MAGIPADQEKRLIGAVCARLRRRPHQILLGSHGCSLRVGIPADQLLETSFIAEEELAKFTYLVRCCRFLARC